MPGRLYIPRQVLASIREHVSSAIEHAEAGYSSSQEEEDTVTGELGGALRTSRDKKVIVTDDQVPGTWIWKIKYSKFRSKAKGATESITGADGIIEVRVGSPERDQRKAVLFQAKNSRKRDPGLIVQCAKMSVWREAAVILNYTSEGYWAYALDEVIKSGGSLPSGGGERLADWVMKSFIACKVGHPDLQYSTDDRRLYWARVPDERSERWVWVDFKPKHLINVVVKPPHWEHSHAVEIVPSKIPLSRLEFTPEDLFGLEAPFTIEQVKKRRAELLHVYHSDRNQRLAPDHQGYFDARVIEINDAFSRLRERAENELKVTTSDDSHVEPSNLGLSEPRQMTMEDLFWPRSTDKKERVHPRESSASSGVRSAEPEPTEDR